MVKALEENNFQNIPDDIKLFFWDIDTASLNLSKHKKFIIERILEIGGYDSFLWLKNIYPEETIKAVLTGNRVLSDRSRIFWCAYLGIEDRGRKEIPASTKTNFIPVPGPRKSRQS
jgi:hypothetical protein